MGLGFNLVDFPDADFLAIDVDNSGEITQEEFKSFFTLAIENNALPCAIPAAPEDDLQFQPTDLSGRLTVACLEAKGLKPNVSWFDSLKNDSVGAARKKTLVFKPIPAANTISLRPAAIEDDEDDALPLREQNKNRAESADGHAMAGMAAMQAAKKVAARAKGLVGDASVAADKLHYSVPLKELEGKRNHFLRQIKTKKLKCSSDSQPKCWDRLPAGVKIEEEYFLKAGESR